MSADVRLRPFLVVTLAALLVAAPAPAPAQGLDEGFGDLHTGGPSGSGSGSGSDAGIFTPAAQSYFDAFTGQATGPGAPAASSRERTATGSDRIFWYQGRRYIRVRLDDRFTTMAAEAYGQEQLWYLIYYQNRALFRAPRPAAGELVLWLPPPPRERVRTDRRPPVLEALPGDTFLGIAGDFAGDPGQWRRFYQAARERLPDPDDPAHLFADPPRVPSRELPLPTTVTGAAAIGAGSPRAPGGTSPTSGATPGYAPGMGGASTDLPAPAPKPPDGGGRIPGPLGAMVLRGPRDVGEVEARMVLEAAGFYHDRILQKHSPPARDRFEAALMALTWGKSYQRPRQRVTLDAERRQWIFEEYQHLREALARYGEWTTVSARARPQAYQAWIRQAAGELSEVNPSQREALMRSLMDTESGRTHWVDHRPVIGTAGEVGFGQFLPATAEGLGINPYDPRENLVGIARYLNRLIRRARQRGRSGRSAVQWGLAAYNGGSNFPDRSVRYAEGILGRLPGQGAMVA